MMMQKQQQAKMAQQYQGPGSKPPGTSMLYGGASSAGGIGAMGSVGAMGGIGSGMGAGGMGGGFTYGAASAGGLVFGAASAAGPIGSQPSMMGFGAGASKAPNSNAPMGFSGKSNPIGAGVSSGFQFGGASSFGAIGSGSASLFGAGSMPRGESDDPYANIDIDLSKVKKAEKPGKPFEQRTEEEKAKADETRGEVSTKSNLKTSKKEEESKGKKEVRFGKSTTYQVEPSEVNDDSEFNNEGTKQGGSPRPSKKIIQETDLSDGRDEKEKIKAQLEQEEKEALEALRKMEEWKKA